MPNTRDIRRRIKSVKSTAQITRAMQLVAASKMKKAQDQTIASRPYAKILHDFIQKLRERETEFSHALLEERSGERSLVLVLSTDKGLCGSLNTNLLRKVENGFAKKETEYVSVGKKGRIYLSRLRRNLLADFEVPDPVPFSQAKVISKFLIEKFLANECDKVFIAYTDFISTIAQKPKIEQLLPLTSFDVAVEIEGERNLKTKSQTQENKSGNTYSSYIYEPSAREVLNTLIPQVVQFHVFQMLLETRASEHSARMVAMKTATDNANDLIDALTLEYNKIRQAAITSELLDISTAMKALE